VRDKTRNKRLQQSRRFLGGNAGSGRTYGVGEIGPDPRRTLFFILCGVVAVAFVSFVVYSVVVLPGVVLIWAVYVVIERSTSLVVTDRGVAILARSEFVGRPRKFVALLPWGILNDPTVQRSGRYVHLPNYRLWLRRKEYDVLMAAVAVQPATPASPPAPGSSSAGWYGATPPPPAMPPTPGPAPVSAPSQTGLPLSPPSAASPNSTEPADSYWSGRAGRTAPGDKRDAR
jgi:hypothetical protein